MLRIDDCVTAVAPTPELADPLMATLAELSPSEVTSPEQLLPQLPGVAEVLGPASLYYPCDPLPAVTPPVSIDVVPVSEAQGLLAAASEEELDESGLAQVTSKVSVIRTEFGEPVSACGYRHWPEQIAHLSVLTRGDHRGRGLAKAVAIDAVGRALAKGLLPQWRARPTASRAVARAIGFEELGAQLSVRIDNA